MLTKIFTLFAVISLCGCDNSTYVEDADFSRVEGGVVEKIIADNYTMTIIFSNRPNLTIKRYNHSWVVVENE